MAPLLVLYDDDCGSCRWSADRLRSWDRRGRLAFAPIQASDAALRAVPAVERLDAMHAVDATGRVWTGGAAVTRLLAELPGGAPLAAVGRRWPGLAERLYRAAARRRATFSRLLGAEACAVDPSRAGP
jgi:predicted DCC family thiol-disulfide oxidoreductase YuxK